MQLLGKTTQDQFKSLLQGSQNVAQGVKNWGQRSIKDVAQMYQQGQQMEDTMFKIPGSNLSLDPTGFTGSLETAGVKAAVPAYKMMNKSIEEFAKKAEPLFKSEGLYDEEIKMVSKKLSDIANKSKGIRGSAIAQEAIEMSQKLDAGGKNVIGEVSKWAENKYADLAKQMAVDKSNSQPRAVLSNVKKALIYLRDKFGRYAGSKVSK